VWDIVRNTGVLIYLLLADESGVLPIGDSREGGLAGMEDLPHDGNCL
jgi:hypothetical protein